MKSIRVYSGKDFNLVAEIDSYNTFTHTRKFRNSGSFEINLSKDKNSFEVFEKGNIVVFNKDLKLSGIIEHREFSEDTKNTMIIKGINPAGILARRIIVPNGKDLYLSFEGKQETIIKGFVDKCLVAANDTKRNISNFKIREDKKRGKDDKWRSAYENLETKISEICEYSGFGFDVLLDIENQSFIFDIVEGRDLTADQDILPPVIFSKKYDNIKSRRYTQSVMNSKNYVYAGTAEEADGIVLGYGAGEGINRQETFENTNGDAAEIKQYAETKLEELKEIDTYEQEVYPDINFIYNQDYKLGDTVTVIDSELNKKINNQIVEVTETHTPIKRELKLTLGQKMPDIVSKLKKLL